MNLICNSQNIKIKNIGIGEFHTGLMENILVSISTNNNGWLIYGSEVY
jgi:hypothetical protein